jgi:hypothetical protein
MPTNKFKPGERPVGRAKGVSNKRTVRLRRALQEVIETAAYQIGSVERLVTWIKEDPINERLFWSQMWIRLLPTKIAGMGPSGEIELSMKLTREEVERKLEERGLPMKVFEMAKPPLLGAAK